MPQARTIASELAPEIEGLLNTGKQFSRHEESLVSLEQKAHALARANPGSGYVVLAAVSMLIGNYDEMWSRFQIARNQGLSAAERLNCVTLLNHAGFFSEAAKVLENIDDASLPNPALDAVRAFSCFQFGRANRMVKRAEGMRIRLPSPTFAMAVAALDQWQRELDMTGQDITDIADLAGEVLREYQTYSGRNSEVALFPDEGEGRYARVTFQVPVSTDRASDMNLALANKLITSGIGIERFIFRFRGSA